MTLFGRVFPLKFIAWHSDVILSYHTDIQNAHAHTYVYTHTSNGVRTRFEVSSISDKRWCTRGPSKKTSIMSGIDDTCLTLTSLRHRVLSHYYYSYNKFIYWHKCARMFIVYLAPLKRGVLCRSSAPAVIQYHLWCYTSCKSRDFIARLSRRRHRIPRIALSSSYRLPAIYNRALYWWTGLIIAAANHVWFSSMDFSSGIYSRKVRLSNNREEE